MQVIDTFLFFNEEDLLDLRLNTLAPYVDKFVIVEGNRTFTNQPKPFNLNLNDERFAPFKDKIVYYQVKEWPGNTLSWSMERHQRNYLNVALDELVHPQDEDVILYSDLDEIPNPDTFVLFKHLDQYPCIIYNQRLFYCFFNMECLDGMRDYDPWIFTNTRAMKWSVAKTMSSNDIRRFQDGAIAVSSGYHFSYLSTFENVVYKIKSFAHTEFATEENLNPEELRARVTQGRDLLNRQFRWSRVELDSTFPKYLLDNQEKYKEFIL